MPNIDLSILNQRQTPAFYADVFANRPAAGFVGRIFISTNTFAFYRDNGTSWDLIGGPGTGTVTGTGANGQVTFWNGASTITGSNDLFWDATNGHLGVNTNAPGTALDVHHDQNTVAILNQTVATNDIRIGFQNNGVALWRIGNFYNAGANDFVIYNATTAASSLLIDSSNNVTSLGSFQSNKGTSGSGTPQFVFKNGNNTRSVLGLIGAEGTNTGSDTFLYNYLDNGTAVPVFRTTRATGNIDFAFSGSFGGKLTVSSATSDNQIQIVGATAPSLRIDNLVTGATKRAGLGISTAANNFIQGSVDRDFCIFNGSTTAASPILFGVYDAGLANIQEAARISAARNFLVGLTTDNGAKFQCSGSGTFGGGGASAYTLDVTGSGRYTSSLNVGSAALTLTTLTVNGDVSVKGQGAYWLRDDDGFSGSAARRAWAITANYDSFGTISFKVSNAAGGNPLTAGTTALDINSSRIATFSNNINIGDTTSAANAVATFQNSANGYQFGFASAGTQRFVFINGGAAEVANINGATGVYTPLSDINKKKNFEDSYLGLDAVLKLKPILYNMKSQEDSEPKELGLIAQEVKEVISQAYVQCDDFIGINYNPIIVTLVKAIQELNTKIENLKN